MSSYSPFRYLAQNDKLYGFNIAVTENLNTIPTLFPTIAEYRDKLIALGQVQPTDFCEYRPTRALMSSAPMSDLYRRRLTDFLTYRADVRGRRVGISWLWRDEAERRDAGIQHVVSLSPSKPPLFRDFVRTFDFNLSSLRFPATSGRTLVSVQPQPWSLRLFRPR